MNSTASTLLPPWVLPPLDWWVRVMVEQEESGSPPQLETEFLLPRQQLFNRYWIHAANGPQRLSLPLLGSRKGHPWRQVQLSPDPDWHRVQLQALQTAYGKAPFWQEYRDELNAWLTSPPLLLSDFALTSQQLLGRALQLPIPLAPDGKEATSMEGTSSAELNFPRPFQALPAKWKTRLEQHLLHQADYPLPCAQMSAVDALVQRGPLVGAALRQTARELAEDLAKETSPPSTVN